MLVPAWPLAPCPVPPWSPPSPPEPGVQVVLVAPRLSLPVPPT